LFALTVLVYPLALALLCVGAGLLIDRCSGGLLPAALLPSVGAAALIGLSQLSTYVSALAPATPYLLLAAALAGPLLARRRATALVALARARAWLLCVPLAVYLLALAPVLLAGRASFSSFMALSDSAVHMIGADYLIAHGQHYAQLDVHNSYGQFLHNYYATGYPSGSDTLFGGSAKLLGLPLIWAFQPFVALMLALCSGPAWLLARAGGLRGRCAALAALGASVPALVYGYELIGSVKEIVSLDMILALGALVVLHRRWLSRSPLAALPIALVLAAGVSALGVGFGAWALAAAAVLLVALAGELRAGRAQPRATLATIGAGALVLLIAAWPTWKHVSASLHVAQNIASTGNAGNLPAPLKGTQVFGIWLRGSYKQPPAGVWQALTVVLIALVIACCVLGALALLRSRRHALLSWIALMLIAWIALSRSATTWVDAKALVLTSSVVMLLAWAGVAALLRPARRRDGASTPPGRRERRPARAAPRLRALAVLLALALSGGVLASDAAQYHSSNLAPTARYEELASINDRFAGRGPALFTDFDEYSMYALRDLDVGGPDFVYPPPALASLAGGYGRPVLLDRASPASLASYPLIVTRRDPSASPPPAAYDLAWQGRYYDVWARRPGVMPAVAHIARPSGRPLACAHVRRALRLARSDGLAAVGAQAPPLARVKLKRAKRPPGWGRERGGFAMRRAGTLTARFAVSHDGLWDVWLQGQFMPRVRVAVDGRPLGSIAGQLAGNSLVPDTATPIAAHLSAGAHRLSITRAGFNLAPGNGGAAVLDAAFLTPARTPARTLRTLPLGADRTALCASSYLWVELVAR
jgi:hypothetical protein